MSIIASSAVSVLVLVLCLCFYACNARSFGVNVDSKETSEGFQQSLSQKDYDQKLNSARVSVQPDRRSAIPNGFNDIAEDEESRFQKTNGNKQPKEANEEHKEMTKSGVKEAESVTSVSWRVPHNKRGDNQQEPGFNFDYLPPKTHPPVHN